MQYEAVYHRTSDNYCYPINENELIINLKTGYDIARVFLLYEDPFQAGILGGTEKWVPREVEIPFKKRLKHHIWWTTTITPPYKRCKYYFKLIDKEGCVINYLEDGFYTDWELEMPGKTYQCFTFPWLNPGDINVTPAWVNDTVWYQIFPERFCNGDLTNDPEGVRPWQTGPVRNDEFYGGDLKGITSRLDYLEKLGVNGLYLTPIFESDSSHKYDTTDYMKIDPHFGTEEDFRELVTKAHDKGIRIMLDGVFNHCGEKFAPWQDVLKNGPESEYYDWFMINNWPFGDNRRDTRDGRYFSFAYYENMPKLNTNNKKVREYLIGVVLHWMTNFGIDGIRLDVANEVSHKFCRELRETTKEINPDFYILGEIWHDSINWLRGDEFDAVMNYPLASGIEDFWLYKERSKEDFEYSINHYYTMYPQQVNDVLFNLLDSHDTNRLMKKVNGNVDVFIQQLAVLYTMPGSPCIYYGTEVAMEGAHDPDCRRCMPWDEIDSGKFDWCIEEVSDLIHMRKNVPECKSRNFHFPNEFINPRVIEYIKIGDSQGNYGRIEVLLNCSEKDQKVENNGREVLFQRGYENEILRTGGTLIRRIG